MSSGGKSFAHTNTSEASPFARRNDKIRDSLSSLTASLDLPSPALVAGACSLCSGLL